MPQAPQNLRHIQALVEIVSSLRGPEGCPWDKEQTHQSLTQYAIEETFEMIEALESGDDAKFKDELGDVLFQVVLHAQLAHERKAFDLLDVIENIAEKLIRRHPHVFAGVNVADTNEVIKNWEEIKKNEKSKSSAPHGLEVPAGLPALQRAYKIGARTQKLGFDWKTPEQVKVKVDEELQELNEALATQDMTAIENEFGDVLFSLAQWARHLKLEPEHLLRKANQRFENRFVEMLEIGQVTKDQFTQLEDTEKEALWIQAKKARKSFE